ncbi:MAG: ankyrin repeat domain-containing protein [Bacillota bacterium]
MRLYEPHAEEETLFDPIELAVAYDSEAIFTYLLDTYDYTDFINTIDLSLLVILLIFGREQFLISTLETLRFSDEHLYMMYDYVVTYRDADDFIALYKKHPIALGYLKWLFIRALEDSDVLDFLIEWHGDDFLFDYDVMYELLSYHPELLSYVEDVGSVDDYMDTDLFKNIVSLGNPEGVKQVITFLLDHGWDLNRRNRFGLTPVHIALRHAASPRTLHDLFELGGDFNLETSLGYKAAHQLILRDAEFTLELADLIDFSEKDAHGLTLQDYDIMQRGETALSIVDVVSVVKLIANLEEFELYNLSEDDFYSLLYMDGVEIFSPYLTMVSLEDAMTRDTLMHELEASGYDVGDINAFKDMFEGNLEQDPQKTLGLGLEFHQVDETLTGFLQDFAKTHGVKLTLESESYAINRMGKIAYHFDKNGNLVKEATIHTTLVDVFYVHRFYGIDLENIEYVPVFKKSQRFLN